MLSCRITSMFGVLPSLGHGRSAVGGRAATKVPSCRSVQCRVKADANSRQVPDKTSNSTAACSALCLSTPLRRAKQSVLEPVMGERSEGYFTGTDINTIASAMLLTGGGGQEAEETSSLERTSCRLVSWRTQGATVEAEHPTREHLMHAAAQHQHVLVEWSDEGQVPLGRL